MSAAALALALALPPALLAAPPAPAGGDPPAGLPPGVLAYEPFEAVAPGAMVVNSDGGTGWDGPWAPHDLYMVGPPPERHPRRADHLLGMGDSLTFPGVVSSGGSASSVALDPHVGAVTRRLAVPVGLPGTVTYVGVLIKPEGRLLAGSLEGGFQVHLDWTGRPYEDRLFVHQRWKGDPSTHRYAFGKPWSLIDSRSRDWCLMHDLLAPHSRVRRVLGRSVNLSLLDTSIGGGSGWHSQQVAARSGVTPGATVFLVMRLETSADGTQSLCSLMFDPDPAGPEPAPEAAILETRQPRSSKAGGHAWLTLASSGAVTFDELRVATTLAGAAGADPAG